MIRPAPSPPLFPYTTLFRSIQIHVWGPASTTEDLRTRLTRYLSPPLFPVRLRDLDRSEEHTSELQSLRHLVCRLLLEKKKSHHDSLAQTVTGHLRTHQAPSD